MTRTISLSIRQTDDLVGLFSILHDQTHVDISIRSWIHDDLLDLSTDERLEEIDVCVVHGSLLLRLGLGLGLLSTLNNVINGDINVAMVEIPTISSDFRILIVP